MPLARSAPRRADLRRAAVLVVIATGLAYLSWRLPQHSDLHSARAAAKGAVYAVAGPICAAGFLLTAVGRVLVGVRAAAALYGRSAKGGVELAGLTGRLGWSRARRHFRPGEIYLEVATGGLPFMPMRVIALTQGQTALTVTADAPWDEATLLTIVSWLSGQGIRVVKLRPPSFERRALAC